MILSAHILGLRTFATRPSRQHLDKFDTPGAPVNHQDGAKETPRTSQDVCHSSDPPILQPVAQGRAIVVRFLARFACLQHVVAAPARSVPQSAKCYQPLLADNGVLRLKKIFSLKISAALDLRPSACTLLAACQ